MFCCVNLARHYKLDPEMVMIKVNHKFEQRFRALEQALREQGISLDDASLAQMEQEWVRAKGVEKTVPWDANVDTGEER
jgi:ATP diphosphatase